MEPIQRTSAVSTVNTSSSNIHQLYITLIRALVSSLKQVFGETPAAIVGTFLTEPLEALKAGFLIPLGWKSHFNFHGLNPTELSSEQKSQNPIILLHGDDHNQSAWLSLSKKLKGATKRAIFTINTENGDQQELNFRNVLLKMALIRRLFGQNIQFDLIGHSNGAEIAHGLASRHAALINKMILLGEVTDKFPSSPYVYEIVGRDDVLVPKTSSRPFSHQKTIACGHLGLLYEEESHAQIIQWLRV